MKKLSLVMLIAMLINCFGLTGFAQKNEIVTVIPDYQIIIDDSSVYYADSLYPFLNYKGITYLPMTYEYARAMNLTTGWLTRVFLVAYQPCDDKLPIYETTVNHKENVAVIPGYKVYVNGKKIDNSEAEYPIFNFRGVTYFPMTWEYAVEDFGWKLSFENNIFKITTENNTADRWTLLEKREKDAVLEYYYAKEIPMKDGSVEHDYITEYYSLDYSTGNMEQLSDYTIDETNTPKNKSVEVTVDNGYAYHNGKKLDGIYIKEAADDYVKPDGAVESGYEVQASTSEVYSPLEVIDVTVRTYNYGKSSNWGTRENHTFIKANDNLIALGLFKTIENVYTLGEDIYFNTVDYGQTIFRHYLQNRKMWKLSKDGELKEIHYGNYNSMKIIGKANGKLYLKCMWSPENHMEDAPYSVSLINDGYYTWDGSGIRFAARYVYSDFDIVSDSGDIFAVDNKSDRITKCKIVPEGWWD